MNHPSPATTTTVRRRLQCLPLAGVVAAACVLTPNGQLTAQTHAAPISTPRMETRAVQFTAFVQEMTAREQDLLELVKSAAATNTSTGPVPLAAADPLATAGGVVVDAIKALGVAVVEAAKSTAVSVISIPLVMLNRAATDPFYLPWLPIGLVAYAFTLPFQVVGTFAYDLVANLTKVVTSLLPAAAGPAPAAAAPAPVAATPSPAATVPTGTTNPVQQAINTVKTRVTDATNAAGSALVAAPLALMSGLQLPPALASFGPLAGAAFAALSPAIAVANFVSVLVTGKALPFNVVKPQLPAISSDAATAPRTTAATKNASAPDSPAAGDAGTNDAPGAEKPATQTDKKPSKAAQKPRTHKTSPPPTASTSPKTATDDSPTKSDSDPAPATKPDKSETKSEKSEKSGTENSSTAQHNSTKGKKAKDKKAKGSAPSADAKAAPAHS